MTVSSPISSPASFPGDAAKHPSVSTSSHPSVGHVGVRVLDIAIAIVALIVLMPLLVLVGLAIYLTDRGPILFAHRRLGQHGREFRCLKFRSMVTNAQERLERLLNSDEGAREEWLRDRKLRNDPRVTSIGNFLRKSSIDEIPQLWNVLVGHMSIVGPRPVVDAERERYGRYYSFYSSVKPGITGLWQVNGRNDVSYRRRIACDVIYAQRCSLSFNAGIILRTVPAVLMNRGSY